MRSDPHDALLLTNRPTTVITQGTALLESMPEPYGASVDEENLFAGIGEDPAPTAVQAVPGPPVIPAIKIPWTMIAFMGAAYFFLLKK